MMYFHCISRLLGGAAALLGDPQSARMHYDKALEMMGKIRFRPEIALAHLEMAELLLDHYPDECAEALEHLDFAITELRDMRMQPSLERAFAVKERAESGPVTAPAYSDGLTEREVEVLRLIAAGKSNREIGDGLFISVRTVERHITNIYRKIDAHGRADAAAYALRQYMDHST
jgi:DNA-binding NarL/FixJ family response regulator